ncbi:MAG: hypothetical protein KBS52_05440, partial [Clostridiales bacterium]|nr:hypothetical protein [Candidatus Equinaster intestinalis]
MFKDEANHKEILTKEKIQQDYRNQAKPSGGFVLLIIIEAVVIAFLVKIATALNNVGTYIEVFLFSAVSIAIV